MKTSTCVISILLSAAVILMAACTAAPTTAPTPLPTFTLEQASPVAPTQSNTVYLPFTQPGNTGNRAAPGPLPQVQVQVSDQDVRVGDEITVTGKVVGIGIPYFYLHVLDEGQQNAPPLAMVTYANEQHPQDGSSQVLALVSATGQPDQAVFVLRANTPGVTGVSVQVTGEIRDASGAQVMSGTGAEPVMITVSP